MDYDIIGISYYSKWSKYDLAGLGKVIAAAHKRYGADVWVVETAYPFTNDYGDTTPNLLGSDLPSRISRHAKGQARYMEDLTQPWWPMAAMAWSIGRQTGFRRGARRWGAGSDGKMPHGSTSQHEALPVMRFMEIRGNKVIRPNRKGPAGRLAGFCVRRGGKPAGPSRRPFVIRT
jgi:arabinogalactan endo-1,4-beta-galactosidase